LLVIPFATEVVNVPVVLPSVMTTPDGTVRLALLLVKATTFQPTVGWFRVIVQVLETPLLRLAGEQFRDTGVAAAVKPTVAFAELPCSEAVTTADCLLLTVAVVTGNEAELADGGTVIDAGTESVVFEVDNATVAPALEAALVRLTVQVLEELDPMLPGLQFKEETSAGPIRLMVEFAELVLYMAVMVAL
jgi:hypothetical protein